MDTLQNLVDACQADETLLRQQAQTRTENWQPWLAPISATHPTGEDPGYDDDVQRIREEVNKLSGIDTARITSLTEQLLTDVTKDIRVMTFYLWARLHQQGEMGLAEGLELLAAALRRYGNALHPQRPRSRQAALTWLGSGRMLDSLSLWPEVSLRSVRRICGALLLISDALDEEEKPLLLPLVRALETRLAQHGVESNTTALHAAHQALSADTQSTPVSAALAPVNSGEALKSQAKLLAKFMREQPGGWLSAHHLMKSVRWDTLSQLPALDGSGNTRLLAPKPDQRAHLKRLYLQQSWLELLELTDTLFSQAINHLWLDLQWYASEAISRSGMDSSLVTIIEQDLNGLLLRLPGLEVLTFSDGTPFADEVTLNWISQRVRNEPGYPEPETLFAGSPVDSDVLSYESEALEKAETEGIETALLWLQQRPGVHAVREQWLLRLIMARLCEQFGRQEMALHLLGELHAQAATLTLSQWSPELLFDVRARRLKLLRVKAARTESERVRLLPEMEALLAGLIAIDPARTAVLCG